MEHERPRLFVALELPASARDSLGALIGALRREVPDSLCRWVCAESIHLTLKFLGETPAARIPALCRVLDGAVVGCAPLTLRPAGIGTFRGRQGIRVLWVGLHGETERVAVLARRVDVAAGGMGWDEEKRPWRPHLTLARVQDRAGREARSRLGEQLKSFVAPVLPTFQVDDVALVVSALRPGGAQYKTLHRAWLT